MLLVQRREQQYGMSDSALIRRHDERHPVGRDHHPVIAGRVSSNKAVHVSGRSPFLLAMERVMPKYDSWTSSSADVDAACWYQVPDGISVTLSSDECSTVALPQGRNPSSHQVCQLPHATAAAGGGLGLVSPDACSVSVPDRHDSVSVRAAKDQLATCLRHRPVSNLHLHDLSQVGKSVRRHVLYVWQL